MTFRNPPLFLFAFSDSKERYLEQLSLEERELRNLHESLEDQHRIRFKSIGSTTYDDIYHTFNRYHNEIALFHYGGHYEGLM